jgi:hypothetical protein
MLDAPDLFVNLPFRQPLKKRLINLNQNNLNYISLLPSPLHPVKLTCFLSLTFALLPLFENNVLSLDQMA